MASARSERPVASFSAAMRSANIEGARLAKERRSSTNGWKSLPVEGDTFDIMASIRRMTGDFVMISTLRALLFSNPSWASPSSSTSCCHSHSSSP